MKSVKLIISVISLVICISTNNLNAQIDCNSAWNIVKHEVLNNDTTNINVYVSTNLYSKYDSIDTYIGKTVSEHFDSWFFFIDDKPYNDWSHNCRYVFVRSDGDSVTVRNEQMPPILENMINIVRYRISDQNIIDIDNDFNESISANSITVSTNNKYAVIISGGMSLANNHVRYWNHCSAFYKTLVNLYNYNPSNIFVLMSDGTNPAHDRTLQDGTTDSSPLDLNGDGMPDIQYSATKSNISTVFNTLANAITTNDDLTIFVTDHGGSFSENSSCFFLWNDYMMDYEFTNEVRKVNTRSTHLILGQCHSGGFIDDFKSFSNYSITTSCRWDESASSKPPYNYSEFLYHWLSAVYKKKPDTNVVVNADSNFDGSISYYEAYQYALSKDGISTEHPQYISTPSNLGANVSLNGYDYQISLSGPDMLCSGDGPFAYSVSNVPANATVTWTCSGGVSLTGGNTGTSCYAKGTTPGYAHIKAAVNINGTTVEFGKNLEIASKSGNPYLSYTSDDRYIYLTIHTPNIYGIRQFIWNATPIGSGGSSQSSTTGPAGDSWSIPKGSYNVECRIVTQCAHLIATTTIGGYRSAVYPNPVDNTLHIDIAEPQETENATTISTQQKVLSSSHELRLFNFQGNLVRNLRATDRQISIDVSALPEGNYFLHIIRADTTEPEVHKVIISH